MSIAQAQKMKELERQVIELAERLKQAEQRLSVLESRPKPGRPTKNVQS